MADLSAYYRVLDLEPDASMDEVKTAWRDLAQVWHPDRFSGNERLQAKALETLKQVNEAYHRINREGEGSKRTGARYEPETHETREPSNDHLEILNEGVEAWNLWRKKYTDIAPRLTGAWLSGRAFENVDFRETDAARANFDRSDFYKANLSMGAFREARFRRAVLHRAIALEADFSGADLTGADLTAADLRGSVFTGAIMEGTTLLGARLDGADLSTAVGLASGQIQDSYSDASTRWPR